MINSTSARQVNEAGASCLLLTSGNSLQVDLDVNALKSFTKILGMENLHFRERKQQVFKELKGIDPVTLGYPCRILADKHNMCLHDSANAEHRGSNWFEKLPYEAL